MTQALAADEAASPALNVTRLALACERARLWPLPGGGRTRRRFDLLRSEAGRDLVLGRLVEAHADAVAITTELGRPLVGPGQRWAVWAAGPADSLRASGCHGGWRVDGTKTWCSGAGLATHALIDATTSSGQQLFAVDLNHRGVVPGPKTWVGPGMARADTRAVSFHQAPAVTVGHPDEYLTRPGFWAGAIGVAACWHGGTISVARPLLDRSRHRREPHLLAHLGAVHVALEQNRAALADAAAQVDGDFGRGHEVLAGWVRATVERNAVEVMDRVGRALGPAPLAHDAEHATLVADLTVYIRQHHGEGDLESIGCRIAELDDPWAT